MSFFVTYALPTCVTMQRATVKLILKNNKKNALGQYPIYLRITANRKRSYISTGYYILKVHWDGKNEVVKPSHTLADQINLDITNRKKQVMDELLQAAIDKKFKSASAVKQIVAEDMRNIFKFSDKLIEEVQHRRAKNTISNYKKHLKKLQDFVGERKLLFDQIDPEFLRSFETWLNDNINKRKEGNNYIAAIMRTIRSHFNEAISRGITSNYPFTKYTLPEETPGNKDFLNLRELKLWHDFTFQTEHETLKEVSLYFLFACYTGLRLSDWKDFAEAKVRERNISLKATKNKAWIVVPLHDGLIQVIKRMKDVPLTVQEGTINRHLKTIATHLKIKKHLSTHSGRKTFAVTMCLERGISSETAAKLMGITLAVFEKNYSYVTAAKIEAETKAAWQDLFNIT
jgi:site-specific recombinase XerD